jgi:hypothetical protein
MKIWQLYSSLDVLFEEGKIVPNVNTTVDVQPGETQRQAAKMGFVLDANGCPPTFQKGARHFTNAKDTVNGGDDWMGPDGTKLKESINEQDIEEVQTIEPFDPKHDGDNDSRLMQWTRDGIPAQVGKIKDWTIHCEDWPNSSTDRPRFYFVNNGRPVGSARLTTIDAQTNHYKIGHIWISPLFQSRGYGFAFYAWLLDQGVILDADSVQTPGSQAMWAKLAKTYKVRMTKDDWASGPLTDVSAAYSAGADSIGLRASKN